MTYEKRLRALAVLVVLAACSSGQTGTTVHNVDREPLYSQGLLRWIAQTETGLVLRVTAPGDDARWAGSVRAALAGMDWLPFASLEVERTGSANTVFHVAAVIDAPPEATADAACAGGIATEALRPVDGRSTILVALCHGGRAISTARALSSVTVSPDSPALADAVRAGAVQAFPLQDPERAGDMPEPVIIIPP